MIDQNQKNKFDKVWAEGDYRLGSTAQRMCPFIKAIIPNGMTINDYGSGTGRAEVELLKDMNYKFNMIDISGIALEDEARAIFKLPQSPLRFFLVDLTDLSAVPRAPWGICINTLMVVQPENLDRIMREIRCTCDNLIMEAYDFPDIRLGMQLTTVQKNGAEWMAFLKEYWFTVEFQKSPESERRYIFVCKG